MIEPGKRPLWIKVGRWVSNHVDCAAESISRIFTRPLNSGVTILVIALALSVPLTLFILSTSLNTNLSNIRQSSDANLFFKEGVSENTIQVFITQLRESKQVESVTYISSEQAANDFKLFSGLGDILESLDSNPLPPSILVRPKAHSLESLEDWLSIVASDPIIEYSEFDFSWLSRLHAILESIERLVFSLGTLMIIAVMMVLGNSVRLEIAIRREEIEVIRLVGGTKAYISRPFLYWGLWFGLLSGLASGIIAFLMAAYVIDAMSEVSTLYFHPFDSDQFGLQQYLVLMLGTAFLGWLGAWLSFQREWQSLAN